MQWLRVANTLHGGAQSPYLGSDSRAQRHQAQVDLWFVALLNGGHEQDDAGSLVSLSYSRF